MARHGHDASARDARSRPVSPPGRFAYGRLDRALHEKARLGILICLAGQVKGVLFGELKRLCALTDGNLSRHLDVLHEGGIIEIWKGFDGRRPQTLCRLSAAGRRRVRAYMRELARVVEDGTTAGHVTGVAVPARLKGWRKVQAGDR